MPLKKQKGALGPWLILISTALAFWTPVSSQALPQIKSFVDYPPKHHHLRGDSDVLVDDDRVSDQAHRSLHDYCLDAIDSSKSGLVGYWPGNGDAYDYSGNEHNGVWCSHDGVCPTYGGYATVGHYPFAFELSALEEETGLPTWNRYVYIPDDQQEFDSIESFTLAFRMKPYYVRDTFESILVKGFGNDDWSYGIYKNADERNSLLAGFSGCAITSNHQVTVSPYGGKLGWWDHVAMTYNHGAGMLKLYINGVIDSFKNCKVFPPHQGIFGFGNKGQKPFWWPWLNGYLDEVTFWNRDLGSSEIHDLYLHGICPVTPRFTLVNAANNQDIRRLDDFDAIDLSLVGTELSIRAHFGPGNRRFFEPPGSVTFELTKPDDSIYLWTESYIPFALFGDDNGNYSPGSFDLGFHVLKATPYQDDYAMGPTTEDPLEIRFDVFQSAKFTLVNTSTGNDSGPLRDGDTIASTLSLPGMYTIRADYPVTPISVKFLLLHNGSQEHEQTEYNEPFALNGDDLQGNYYPFPFTPGEYTLIATYDIGRPVAHSETRIHFTVLGDAAQTPGPETPKPTPLPTDKLTDEPRKSVCTYHCVDFSETSNGSKLHGGEYVKDDWSAWGMSIFAASSDGGYTPDGKARILNTASPGGDVDLGSPNAACPDGGPGVGDGGKPKQSGSNCVPQGNVLIIQEENKQEVDDNAYGGTITFAFEQPAIVYEVTLLDVDGPNEAALTITKASGETSNPAPVKGLGDNSVEIVYMYEQDVTSIALELKHSGAVSMICFCA